MVEHNAFKEIIQINKLANFDQEIFEVHKEICSLP